MINIFRDDKHSRSWSEIVYDFFDIFTMRMNEAVRRQQLKVLKIASAFIFFAIGAIFFLIGSALFVGKLINDASWSGYLVVGAVLIFAGWMMPRR